VTAAAGKDVAAYFKGNQDRRNMFVDGRSGPDRVPGNLFPAREIYFPGINIPNHNTALCITVHRAVKRTRRLA